VWFNLDSGNTYTFWQRCGAVVGRTHTDERAWAPYACRSTPRAALSTEPHRVFIFRSGGQRFFLLAFVFLSAGVFLTVVSGRTHTDESEWAPYACHLPRHQRSSMFWDVERRAPTFCRFSQNLQNPPFGDFGLARSIGSGTFLGVCFLDTIRLFSG